MNDDRHLAHIIARGNRKPKKTRDEQARNLAEYLESL